MKKTVKKDELPDIAEWINSHQRRAVPPAKAFAIYEEAPEAETVKREQPSSWHKVIAVIGLSASAAVLGMYLCNGYIMSPPPKTIPKFQKPEIHEVAPGETLWGVAGQYTDNSQDIREAVYKIMKDNNADAGNLQPGQKLVIYR